MPTRMSTFSAPEIGVATPSEERRPDSEGAVLGAGDAQLGDTGEELEEQAADPAIELGDCSLALESVVRGDAGDERSDASRARLRRATVF